MTKTIEVSEDLVWSQLVDLARDRNDVILAQNNTPVARLTLIPAASQAAPRIAGLHRGASLVSDNFDEQLPDSFWVGQE